jgi:hypothetical protein
MKRLSLYFLLLLFIAGLTLLAYGFWNAKNIRIWAVAAGNIKFQHDIRSKEKDITNRFDASGGKTAEELDAEIGIYISDLGGLADGLKSAGADTEKISAPKEVDQTRTELMDFYKNSGEQVGHIAAVAEFLKGVLETTETFDKIKSDASVQEIKDMISDAKLKSNDINADILPPELKDSGSELKMATENYLDQFDQYAAGQVENHDQLNAGYDVFSEKLNDFLLSKKNYFDSFQDTDQLSQKIDTDLIVLRKVKFSVK